MKNIDIEKMSMETGIGISKIKEALRIRVRLGTYTFTQAQEEYRDSPCGSKEEKIAIRKIAEFYKKKTIKKKYDPD